MGSWGLWDQSKMTLNMLIIFIQHRSWIQSSMNSHRKMTLNMKRDTFKMLLMKVNTQYSDEIYRYLIAFENQVKICYLST